MRALHSPPARFFLKGRDRDVFDALADNCTGSRLRVRVIPVHVTVSINLYKGEWEVSKDPAEMQLLSALEQQGDFDRGRKPRGRDWRPDVPLEWTVEEVLAFTQHGGTVDRTARELKAPQTLFVNQTAWIRQLISHRAVHSTHEADFDPRGESLEQLSHAKRAYSWGATAGDCVGNAGYDEEIDLQYISAAIVVEQEESDDGDE